MSRPLLADDPRRLGAWHLIARVGEGGFGVVYEAEDDEDRWGAVKVMHRHLATHADYVAAVTASADAAVAARFLLAADRDRIVDEAEAAPIPT